MGRDLFADSSLSGPSVEGHRTPDLRFRPAHFAPKAKAVIHLFMNGGPSQVDLFDPKPLLSKFAGSPPSRDILAEIEFADQVGTMLPSPFKFARHGNCGMEVSELLPHLAERVDDITLIRSMFGDTSTTSRLSISCIGAYASGTALAGSW